jgi:hypothetical protein
MTLTTYQARTDRAVPKLHFKDQRIEYVTAYLARMMQRHILIDEQVKEKLSYDFVERVVAADDVFEFEMEVEPEEYDDLKDLPDLDDHDMEAVAEGLSEYFKPAGQLHKQHGSYYLI